MEGSQQMTVKFTFVLAVSGNAMLLENKTIDVVSGQGLKCVDTIDC